MSEEGWPWFLSRHRPFFFFFEGRKGEKGEKGKRGKEGREGSLEMKAVGNKLFLGGLINYGNE